jgi:hypothetical protein
MPLQVAKVLCRSAAVKEFTQEQLALMRTQDVVYLRRAVQAEISVRAVTGAMSAYFLQTSGQLMHL